jgi:hypothetical protein
MKRHTNHTREAAMSATTPKPSPLHPAEHLTVEELARRQGIDLEVPTSLEHWRKNSPFESDEEIDAFIAYTYAMRRADLAWPVWPDK